MKIVIIGAGPAGVSVVETVRSHNRHIELVMLSAEPYPPYSPPAMADHFLYGSNAHMWRGPDWADQMDVDYRSGVLVKTLDPQAHHITLADGTSLAYDRLVIATGGSLYAPLEGIELPGVYNFKSLSAAEALVNRVREGHASKAVIVGAGFIGMEIALLLRKLGLEVLQIEMEDQVMPTMLDTDTAAIALALMQERGIDVRLNTRGIAFAGNGRATGVALESGDTLDADIFVAATGVKPNLALLDGSGIEHGWGITVDDHLCTSASEICAAGDVIETTDRLTGETYVHAIFPNAIEQGRVVALNLLDFQVAYEGADRMNSLKHLGLPIMAVGLKEGDEVLRVQRGKALRTLYLSEDRLVGCQLVADTRSAGILRSLINRKQDVGPLKKHLLDPNFGQGAVAWSAISPL